MPLFARQPTSKLVSSDAELNSAPKPSGFRDNPTSIANSDRQYLEKYLRKAVFGPQVPLFARRPPSKLVSSDVELNSAPNPSCFRDNPTNIANPERQYLEKYLKKAVFGPQVPLFPRRPPSKLVSSDVELNSAPNPSGFRDNPTSIANPDRQYLEKYLKKQYSAVKWLFLVDNLSSNWDHRTQN